MSIKIFTAFSGYDSQCLALKYLGLDFELVGWSDIDKYAIQAHNLLFPQYKDRNFGDICKIDWNNVPNFDLFTYSFPCTDISIAGRRKGFAEESNTRSSLLWQCKKAIEVKRPKYLLM
ncbi:MAG: DNA cytosine methyltransferase [Bacteroidales bacterium]|nr:DNA cytosine methyltransferase [Bacteroidales bacterium]